MSLAMTKTVTEKTFRATTQFLPGATVGILGGGQLGRMFAIAAAQLGYRVVVYHDNADCPAGKVSHSLVIGKLSDTEAIDRFAAMCDVVTLEFENLSTDAVAYLASKVPVYPTAEVLRIAQDRRFEKQTFADAGLAVTPFCVVNDHSSLREAIDKLGLPIVLKTARDGYDGKGQWKISEDQSPHFKTFVIDRPMIAEAWITYQRELSVIVARSHDGSAAAYPVFENRHNNHILDVTICPANVSEQTQTAAVQLAIAAAIAIDLVGLMCIEMFQDSEGRLMINEVAPRPHNSGHLTIEACQTSQFEQQVRVVCKLPLGDTSLRVPAAAMVNLMGELWSDDEPEWAIALSSPGVHLHLYDKGHPATGRKMGHMTATGDDAELLATRLSEIRDQL